MFVALRACVRLLRVLLCSHRVRDNDQLRRPGFDRLHILSPPESDHAEHEERQPEHQPHDRKHRASVPITAHRCGEEEGAGEGTVGSTGDQTEARGQESTALG